MGAFRSAMGSNATSGKNPPHFETILSGAFGIGVVIQPPVPAVRRDLGDGVEARGAYSTRTARRWPRRENRGHADDGDIRRPRPGQFRLDGFDILVRFALE